MSTSDLPYISPHGTTGWLVRVPYAYLHNLNSKRLQYKQKLFTFLKHGGRDKALVKAKEFRDLHCIKGLKYNDRGAGAGNGRQVAGKRKRGTDLPVGITDTIRHSRQGNEQYSIDVQAMCGNVSRSRSYMYGHSRTREEAIVLAEKKLTEFLNEIEDTLS